MKSTTTRQLTHKLFCDPLTFRWSCRCGYQLGDGHDALYAQCPLAPKPAPEIRVACLLDEGDPDAYIEFDISTPTHEKKPQTVATPKRQAGRRVARIYRKGQDLFQ